MIQYSSVYVAYYSPSMMSILTLYPLERNLKIMSFFAVHTIFVKTIELVLYFVLMRKV